MSHHVAKQYVEPDASGNRVEVVVCECGWKEKSTDVVLLLGQHQRHQKFPHTT